MNALPESSAATPAPLAAYPAALGWRLLALLYDLLPLLGVWFAVAALMLLLRFGQPVEPGGVSALAEQALLLAATFAYFGWSWRRGGQTLGMRAWRLRLLDAGGGVPSWRRIFVRAAVAVLSLAAFGLGFLWSLVERERRSWHDLASGTVVVRLPKPPKKV